MNAGASALLQRRSRACPGYIAGSTDLVAVGAHAAVDGVAVGNDQHSLAVSDAAALPKGQAHLESHRKDVMADSRVRLTLSDVAVSWWLERAHDANDARQAVQTREGHAHSYTRWNWLQTAPTPTSLNRRVASRAASSGGGASPSCASMEVTVPPDSSRRIASCASGERYLWTNAHRLKCAAVPCLS